MYQIDIMSRVPVYEQIVKQTEQFILTGILKPGDKMISVRNMSLELSVNPNTIQKALAELDRRGLITSVPGKGSFIATNALNVLFASGMNNLQKLKEDIEKLKLAGVDKQQIREIIDEVYVND